MPGFAGFEGVKEIYQSGGKTMWLARRAGSTAAPTYALTVLDPSLTGAAPKESRRLIDDFLDRAVVQKKAASAGGLRTSHWARVYEAGETDGAAAVVTDFYRRNLEAQIKTKVAVDERVLYRIIRGIVSGLREINSACARSHGDLEPGSVLIAGSGPLAQARVALTGPAPSRSVEGKTEQADFKRLGEIIYQVVTHRPLPPPQLPLQPDDPWTRLGRKGEGWCALCSDLLDESSSRFPADLRELRRRIRKLRPLPLTRATIVAGLVVVLAVAFSTYLVVRQLVELPPESQWAIVCNDYCFWLTTLLQNEDLKGSKEFPKLAGDVEGLDQYHPKIILKDPTIYLDEDYTDRSKRFSALSWPKIKDQPKTIDQIRQAFSRISKLRADLNEELFGRERVDSNGTPLKDSNGKLLPDVGGFPGALKEIGCTTASEKFSSRCGSITEWKKETYSRIHEVVVSRTTIIESLDETIPAIRQDIADLNAPDAKKINEPVLGSYPRFLDESTGGAESLVDLCRRLNDAKAIGDRLRDALKRIEEGASPDVRVARDVTHPTREMYDEWLAHVEEPLKEPIFNQWKIKNQGTLDGDARVLATIANDAAFQDPAQQLAKRLQVLQDRFEKEQKKPWTQPGRKTAEAVLAALSDDLKTLTSDIELLSNRATIERTATFANQSLNDAWNRVCDDFKKTSDAPRISSQTAFQNLYSTLKELDDSGKLQLEGSADWVEGIRKYYVKARAEHLQNRVDKQTLKLGVVQYSLSRWTQETRADLDALRDRVLNVAKQCSLITSALADLHNGEEAKEKQAQSDLRHAADAAAQAVASDPDLAAQIRTLLSNAHAVLDVRSENRDALQKDWDTATTDVLWAKWTALGQLPDRWPGGVEELKSDLRLREMLMKAGVTPVVQKRLADAASTRLEACVSTLIAAPDAHVELSKIPPDLWSNLPRLSQAAQFDIMLGRMIAELTKDGATDRIAEQWVKSISPYFVKSTDNDVASEAKSLGDEAAQLKQQFNARAVPDKVGPATAPGWTQQLLGKVYRFTFGGTADKPAHELVFLRTTPVPTSSTVCYLCTKEVPVRLFSDVAGTAAADWPEWQLSRWFNKASRDPRWGTPHVWNWSKAGKFVGADQWVDLQPADKDKQLALRSVPPPSLDCPMQHIPATVADRFCRTLGCRLPTPQEWTQAVNASLKSPDGRTNNLCDLSWLGIFDDLVKQGADQVTLEATCAGFLEIKLRAGDHPEVARWKDGAVFYREVPRHDETGKETFHDLIGNVAEWVGPIEGKMCNVIGGSALTATWQMPPEDQRLRADSYYSDVGFRLAFDAPVQGVAETLALHWREKHYVKIK